MNRSQRAAIISLRQAEPAKEVKATWGDIVSALAGLIVLGLLFLLLFVLWPVL